MIEGKHDSLKAVMADPTTTTFDIITFGGKAEDAVKSCNSDKESVKAILGGAK